MIVTNRLCFQNKGVTDFYLSRWMLLKTVNNMMTTITSDDDINSYLFLDMYLHLQTNN